MFGDVDLFLDDLVVDARQRLMLRPPRWTKQEEDFLRQNLGKMSYAEIGAALGRSENAIKIRQVRRRLPAPSKLEGTLTGNVAARALGVDVKSLVKMGERGIIQMERVPGERGILRISKLRLYMWAINPDHWIYFKIRRMQDRHLQRLVMLAQARWNDEWWTIGQAERALGVKLGLLNSKLHRDKLGEKLVRWGNFWIRKSDALQIVIFPSMYNHEGVNYYSPRADAFLLRAVKDGIPYAVIGAMMGGWSRHEVFHRLKMLGWTGTPGGTKGARKKWKIPTGKPVGRENLLRRKGRAK